MAHWDAPSFFSFGEGGGGDVWFPPLGVAFQGALLCAAGFQMRKAPEIRKANLEALEIACTTGQGRAGEGGAGEQRGTGQHLRTTAPAVCPGVGVSLDAARPEMCCVCCFCDRGRTRT